MTDQNERRSTNRVAMITPPVLAKVMACPEQRAIKHYAAINGAMLTYDINTLDRSTMFLAQIGHESGGLAYVKELWGPTPAQRRYEGRLDLGNTEVGDGFRYRGRGLIQITGRANYKRVSDALGVDFVTHPEELESPQYAAMSAAWYWKTHGCNELADQDDFERVTRAINGGLNGFTDRVVRLKVARAVLLGA